MTPGGFRATLVRLRRLIVDEQHEHALNLIDVLLKTSDEEKSVTATMAEARRAGAEKIQALVEKTTAKVLADAKMTLNCGCPDAYIFGHHLPECAHGR